MTEISFSLAPSHPGKKEWYNLCIAFKKLRVLFRDVARVRALLNEKEFLRRDNVITSLLVS